MICSFDAHPSKEVILNCTHPDKRNKYNGTPLCNECYADAQRQSEANWATHRAETNACPNCQAARKRQFIRGQRTETIDPSTIYGEHIPLLCRNHLDDPTMRWNTKNINSGRSIFFNSWPAPECDCPGRDLFSPGRFIFKLCYLLGTDNTYTGD